MDNNYLKSLALSPGWLHLKKYLEDLVEEALSEMQAHKSDDPMAYMRLMLRWQQRGIIKDRTIQFVEAYKNGDDTDNSEPGDDFSPTSYQ